MKQEPIPVPAEEEHPLETWLHFGNEDGRSAHSRQLSPDVIALSAILVKNTNLRCINFLTIVFNVGLSRFEQFDGKQRMICI